jgi:hypothetical protein
MSIVVSYAQTDREMAEELASFLSVRGWDARLVGSDESRDAISPQAPEAAAVIVIWSQGSAGSPLVRRKADEALHRKRLIATRVRGLDMGQIPLAFRRQHTAYVDEREEIATALARMGVVPPERPPRHGPGNAPGARSAGVGDGAALREGPPRVVQTQSAWARSFPTRIGEAIAAAALLVCGAFFAWHASYLPFGEVGLPGPGFFPFALGILLGALGLVLLLRTWWTADLGRSFLGHRDVLVTVLALVGVAVALELAERYPVDAYLVLGTFTGVMLLVVARTALWRAALGACLGMIGVWAVFSWALGVRLPAADFWEYIKIWKYIWRPIADSAAATLPSAPF